MQYFKGDQVEVKFFQAFNNAMNDIALGKDQLFEDCYNAYPLGDAIHNTQSAPLTNAISRNVFREAFSELFQAFIEVGTAEAYLTVFRKIFGESVVVDFTIVDPAVLNIDIVASAVELSDFISRQIINEEYVFSEIVDGEGDNIAFQGVKGLTSQQELESMLFEMVPQGIVASIDVEILIEE